MLQKMINVGQPLSTSMVQPILRGMIESLAPNILCNGHGGFVVTREWTRIFFKHYMNWYFHMVITLIRKMPTYWHEQGCNMAYHITYLVKFNSIPPCLVVNTKEIGIHFVPIDGEKTWENKGSKHIQVLGVE